MWSATVKRACCAAAILGSASLVWSSDGALASDVESFRPVHTSGNAVSFRISGIEPAAIERAKASLRVRPRHGKGARRLSRALPVGRVRAAVAKGGELRLRGSGKVLGGRLRVKTSPSGCAVDPATMTAAGCSVVTADTAAQPDAVSLWRSLDCANASRYSYATSGGDPAPTATGQSQGNSSYRQLTVMDGDDVYGERCELGKNNLDDTFQLYREGQRRITFASFRLPGDYPLAVNHWHQVVLQMKQTQPSNNGGGTPVLAVHAVDGEWRLNQSDSPGPSSHAAKIWSMPAQKGVWTRLAFDITYSQDSDLGRIKLYIDANGDGDAADPGEQSPTINTYTLKYETAGTDDAVAVGASIPSHLRVGPYRNPDLDCPATGCSVQVDNVEVVKAR